MPAVLAETQLTSQTPPREQLAEGNSSGRSPRRLWLRVLLGCAAASTIIGGGTLFFVNGSSPKETANLTYTVRSGDLVVTVSEQGILESAENTEVKCKVRGAKIPITWIVENGTVVKPNDLLVRLDTKVFDDRFTEMTKWTNMTKSGLAWAKTNKEVAELAVDEYEQGRYVAQMMDLEKNLAIAESNLRTAQSMLTHAQMMAKQKYTSDVAVEEAAFAVTRAEQAVAARRTDIGVLKNYTKAIEMETLVGDRKAKQAKHDAETSRLKQVTQSLKLSEKDIEHCEVRAERGGLVIYPSNQPWENKPKIQVGATVHMGQTMLIMPDLSRMQVMVGFPEAVVHNIRTGLEADVIMHNKRLRGHIESVSSSAAPAKWYTGNVARYKTIIAIPSQPGLNPGMSAEVVVISARHTNVLTIPVAAIVEKDERTTCWVETPDGPRRRVIQLGDTNDVFTIVATGLKEGDKVFLNPFAFEAPGTKKKEADKKKEPKKKPASDGQEQAKTTT